MILLTLKLVMSPKLPLSAPDYGKDIETGIHGFMSRYADNMDTNGIPVSKMFMTLVMDIFILDSYVVILFSDKWTSWGEYLGLKLCPVNGLFGPHFF